MHAQSAQSLPLICERDHDSWYLSLCVNAETCDLGEVRCGREVGYIHVVKDLVSVEPAKEEEPQVRQERSMMTSRRRPAEGRAGLISQEHSLKK